MMGSLPICSTAFFTKVEMVAWVELLEGAMVVGWRMVLLVKVAVTTFSTASFSKIAEPRRDVGGGASQVRGVGHGGDDGDGGVIIHPLVDGGQVVAHRHLLRVPLYLVPQSHHVL